MFVFGFDKSVTIKYDGGLVDPSGIYPISAIRNRRRYIISLMNGDNVTFNKKEPNVRRTNYKDFVLEIRNNSFVKEKYYLKVKFLVIWKDEEISERKYYRNAFDFYGNQKIKKSIFKIDI